MKVLYLYQYFVTPTHHGMTRAYEFARRLIASGHEVKVVTSPGYLPEEYKHFTKVTEVTIDGIPTLIIPVAYSHNMPFTRRIFSFIRFAFHASVTSMKTPADVVYASSGPLTIAIPAISTKIWQRIPMVFEVRDLWPEMPIALGILRNPILKSIAHMMEWVAYHSAEHIVALSSGMAEGIQKRGIHSDRVTVIPNSSDVDMFDVSEEVGHQFRKDNHIDLNIPLIVYTGTFGFANQVGYMVDIASEMQTIDLEIKFLLVGTGREFDLVKQKAIDYGLLDKSVVIWDAISKIKIPAILSAATLTSSWVIDIKEMENNSANKFFDLMAAGRPIVINHGGWQADLINETGTGLSVPANDAQTAAQLIAEFVRDKQRTQNARLSAKNLAHNRFHRDKMYEIFETVLKRVVASNDR